MFCKLITVAAAVAARSAAMSPLPPLVLLPLPRVLLLLLPLTTPKVFRRYRPGVRLLRMFCSRAWLLILFWLATHAPKTTQNEQFPNC